MVELARLEEFERAVYFRAREDRIAENQKALDTMFQCLTALRSGAYFAQGDRVMKPAELTRMCAAIVALFCDPGFRLTQDGFNKIAAEKAVIDTLFIASAFETPDYVYGLIDDETEHLNKYLLLFSINSELDLDLETVFRQDPQATFGLYLSLLGYGQVFTPQADARREKLIGMAAIFDEVMPDPMLYNALCGAYMHVSYAHGRDKHAPKRVIHRMMERVMAPHVAQKPFGPQARKARPTVLMVFEWWHSKHAMYRSYAKSIMQLKRDFRIVGTCPGQIADDESKLLFDEWLDFPGDQMVLAQIAERFQALAPDIIYYPSIGMGVWVIAMSSLRLAPIQVMTYGHPATSNSPVIDYGLIEEDCLDPSRFSERMIALPANTVKPTPYAEVAARHTPRKTDVVRIAISAMQVKVTWPFVQALQQVMERANKTVELWFFSATSGIGMHSMANELSKYLANVTVQEQQLYEEYMQTMAECDLCLFSFPFGGANSAYDALTLGLPMVSIEGDEPHSKSDASIIRRAGLPESLIAQSVDEYVEIILRLLDDDERARIANLTAAVDMETRFHTPDASNAFVDAFRNIYLTNTVEEAA